ncbi:aminotransferase DegT [Candidatus Dependentiae bacterium]|nr:aminotransferase DegT [Candidatus Dependentiae bacterium]
MFELCLEKNKSFIQKTKKLENFIPVNRPILKGNEKKYVNECIESGWISSEGSFVKRFEEKFATYVERRFGIAVCNGSVALDVAINALGIKEGDEVIMPTFTIISCAAALVRAGAIPVLVDSDPITWNMNVEQIEKNITEKTKAIMVVHIYGLPVDLDPILNLAKKHKLKIIEDAAQMHGQNYKSKKCGSFGDVSTFSFYPNKHITTGEGGMVLTDDENLSEKCRSLRNLCFKKEKRFVHDELGFNFRMTNIQAALGLAQLEQIDRFIDVKREMGKFYTKNLKENLNIDLPLESTNYAQNIYWVYGIVLNQQFKFDAENIMQKLNVKGIGTRPFFWCMHEQPVFKKLGFFKNQKFPIAENLARRGFYIPSGLGLKRTEMERVCSVLKEVLR